MPKHVCTVASQNNANNVAALSFLIYRSHAGRCRLRIFAATENYDDSCDRTSISHGPGRIDFEEGSSKDLQDRLLRWKKEVHSSPYM